MRLNKIYRNRESQYFNNYICSHPIVLWLNFKDSILSIMDSYDIMIVLFSIIMIIIIWGYGVLLKSDKNSKRKIQLLDQIRDEELSHIHDIIQNHWEANTATVRRFGEDVGEKIEDKVRDHAIDSANRAYQRRIEELKKEFNFLK